MTELQHPLTLNSLEAAILQLLDAGAGADAQVVIPVETGRVTVGARPSVTLTELRPGFDWDAGKVLLQPAQPLGIAGPELERLKEILKEATEALFWIERELRDFGATDTARIAKLKFVQQVVAAWKAHSAL